MLENPLDLEMIENIVLANGRVNKMMKVYAIHGFAYDTGNITMHLYRGVCANGIFDIMSAGCSQNLGYSSINNNKGLNLEYQCKPDTLLDLALGICR